MYWISKSFHYLNRFRRHLLIFFAVLGPSIITMVADNYAGGICHQRRIRFHSSRTEGRKRSDQNRHRSISALA
jgi:hypothetical protein